MVAPFRVSGLFRREKVVPPEEKTKNKPERKNRVPA